MNKLWKQLAIATNWPILVAVLVLSALGLVSIWAHSIADPRSAQDVQKQIMFIAIGTTLMFAMQAVNYLQLGRWGWPFYLLSLELMKVAFCIVLARYLRFRSNYRSMLGLLAPFGLVIVPLIVILKQPDLGTA